MLRARAISSRVVNVLFPAPVLVNPALVDATNYVVSTPSGLVPTAAVTAVGGQTDRVRLEISTDIALGIAHSLHLLPGILLVGGGPLGDVDADFSWWGQRLRMSSPVAHFARESGPPIQPGVFFAPGGGPGSIVEVAEVGVCSRAYDVYRIPGVVPTYNGLLAVWGSGVPNTIDPGVATFGDPQRCEARFALVDLRSETVDPLTEVSVTGTSRQVYDPARFSLLNSPAWHIWDGSGLSVRVADTTQPLGPPIDTPVVF